MTRPASFLLGALALAGMAWCVPTWKHEGGRQALPPGFYNEPAAGRDEAGKSFESRRVSFLVPDGWHWYDRGQDFIATRDGVFLQQIFLERIHVGQSDQAVMGAHPLAVLSSKRWPVRTAKNLKRRFSEDMPPADAAEVLLDGRRNDPAVADLAVLKVVTRILAGRQAFRAVFEFWLKDAVIGPLPLYRSVYCGFMRGDWFYGVSFTAAARYYFDWDAGTFETFVGSLMLADP